MSFIDKFPEQGRILCEECTLKGIKSRVHWLHFTNRTEYDSYWDEDGIRTQVPPLEIMTDVYSCGNGHVWSESRVRRTDRDVVGD